MSVIDKIAFYQDRRDEIPNQNLAKELVETENQAGIREIAENLFQDNKSIQSDCIKVLYEIGYEKPELIAGYTCDFIKLLKSRNNRLVWGAMIALSTVANISASVISQHLDAIYTAMNSGSVITIDNGIKVIAAVAAYNGPESNALVTYLIEHLKSCRPKEVAQHAESSLIAINSNNKDEFIQVLKEREKHLTNSQLSRIKRIYKALDKIN